MSAATAVAGLSVPARLAPLAALLAAAAVLGGARELGTHHSELGGADLSRPAAIAHGRGLSSLPSAARGPVSAALGAASPAYAVHGSGTALRAANPANRFQIAFGRGGVSVRTGGAGLSMRLVAAGSGARLAKLAPAAPRARANRVSYRHGPLTEWYANGPLGLEQGFTLARPLAHELTAGAGGLTAGAGGLTAGAGGLTAGAGELTLALRLGGRLRPALTAHGHALSFTGGRVTLAYRDLVASGAGGRSLPTRMALRGRLLLLAIDARGARYPLRIDPVLAQIAQLTASDGGAGDEFGGSAGIAGPGEDDAVAIDGSTIAVGAPGHDGSAGAVYVFSEPASGWQDATQTAELTASDSTGDDELGNAVAISGSTIVAGAPGHDESVGAVYVFTEPAGGWRNATQTAELTAPDANCGGPNCLLGASVAIDGSTIVAGAPQGGNADSVPGLAYVFSEPAGGWQNATETATLSEPNGCNGDGFGFSVAVSGSTIAVGAAYATPGCTLDDSYGAVYAFTEPGGGWASTSQAAALTASDAGDGDDLGWSVATDGATIVAGAPYHAVSGNSQAGAVYVYSEPASGWQSGTQTAELTASDGGADDDLGWSVSVNGPTILAGAPFHPVSSTGGIGAVYAFAEAASGWASGTQTVELTRTGGADVDELGKSVAGGGSAAIVAGDPFRTIGDNTQQGAAYVFGAASTTTTPPATSRPTLSDLRQSRASWREGSKLPSLSRKRKPKPPVGTTFSFRLSVAADLRLTFDQRLSGRRVGRRCVAVSARNRHDRACTRLLGRGTLKRSEAAGAGRLLFEGRVSASRRLPLGAYTVTFVASDSGGSSAAHTLRFKIVR